MMRFYSVVALLLAAVPTATGASHFPTPATTAATPAATASFCSASTTTAQPPIFGVSQRLPAALSMRGGEVFEPESLQDVEAILLKAGAEQKLVVIDFSATWYVVFN